MTTVWVYAEVRPEGPSPAALELLTKAREIGDEVAAVALGPGATESAPALGEHGASTVYVSDDPVYAETLGQPAAHALAELAEAHDPALILFSTSYDARDVAGRLQAKLKDKLEQIDRARRLVDTVPGEQRAMFQALLVQTQVQRDQIQVELDTLGERLKQTETPDA